MKKNHIILILIIIFTCVSLILSLNSCGIFETGKNNSAASLSQTKSDDTQTSFDLAKELNTLKGKLVNPPVITSHLTDQVISSNNQKELIILKGKADPGSKIEIKINGIIFDKRYGVDNEGNFETTDGVEIVEGLNTVEVYAVNPEGDKSEPTKLKFILNVQKNLDYKVYENKENMAEISNSFYSKDFEPIVYIQGLSLPSADIYLKVNDKILGQSIADSTGAFAFENVKLENGENTVSVWYIPENGQPGVPVNKNILVVKSISSPDPSSLTGYVGSDGNHLNWTRSSDSKFVSYKIVRVDDPVKNPHYPEDNVIATITDKNILSYTDKDIISGKAYFYTLWTLDKAGNLISSNVLPLPAPKYTISIKRLPSLQGDVLARREWYYEYFEITNTGNVPVYIQPILVWFLLEPESDPEMALNPLWSVYIWDPSTGTYYYSNDDIRESHVSDWVSRGTTQRTETVIYSDDGLTKTTTVLEIYRIAEENVGKRIVTIDKTTTITIEDLVTGTSTTTTAHEVSKAIAEPEKVGNLIGGIQPGEKIKLAVKIANVAADNGDKITVHFNFAPADSLGYFFTDDIVSTGDIFITSSGK